MRLMCLVVLVFLLCPVYILAQNISELGGDLTTSLTGHNAIQVAAPNVTTEERRLTQLAGFTEFHQSFTRSMGLGPKFVNASCAGCHVQNGKGPANFKDSITGQSAMVIKVGRRAKDDLGNHKPIRGVGRQIQNITTSGKRLYDIRLAWEFITDRYSDGTKYRLRKPQLRFKLPKLRSSLVRSSLRMSPILVGMGLLEAVPDATILALSDPDDLDRDGISGRPNYVRDIRTGAIKIGRFGFKATHPTVEQQTAAALIGDMGVTNELFRASDNSYEYPDNAFDKLLLYQLIPGVPRATSQDDAQVVRGKELFQTIGCNSCHVMTLVTGPNENPELANQTIHPFTDMLLHDMGASLSDGFAEFSAKPTEWRTTPLWGLGFAETVSSIRPLYLHDGRARSIQEAILWHGGEARNSRLAFRSLPAVDRAALVRFLRSL